VDPFVIFILVIVGLIFGVLYPLMFLLAWITRNKPCSIDGCFCKTWTCGRCGRTWTVKGVNWFHNSEALFPVALNHMQRCW